MMETDPWLDRWLPLIAENALDSTVLELGCNAGRDTAHLAQAGFHVVATDISRDALQACHRAVPSALLLCHDLREPLPFADGVFGVIVASLCLHYFDWNKTREIVAGIHRCLSPGGVLLCRVNSTRDVHHGADGAVVLEPNYFLVEGRYSSRKRFFDRAAIDALFGPEWARIAMEEMTVDRYEKPKVVWEAVLRKAGARQ